MINQKEFAIRRQKLIEQLPEQSITVLFSGQLIKSSNDATYPFFVNRNFFYLTGIEQEHSALLIIKTSDMVKTYLFIDEIDELKTRWVGKKLSMEEAKNISGITDLLYMSMFDIRLKEMLANNSTFGSIKTCYFDLEKNLVIGSQLQTTETYATQLLQDYPHVTRENVYPIITRLRMIKSPQEVDAIRQAIKATGYGLSQIRKYLKPGLYEYQLEGLFAYSIKEYGNLTTSFDTIIAAGKNAVVLHYPNPQDKINDGVLVLCDLGARYWGYSGDITRTYPANRSFNPLQKQVYNIVLQANEMVIAMAKPGLTIVDLQKATIEFLTKACLKEGLIKTPEEIGSIYYHNVSHHLGLDTHDPIGRDLPLEPGCVITVEPGLYIKSLGIGIRIEDDILITNDGCENLSISIPKSIKELEANS
jgi:Xaa-Pro aminopeptidase